MTRLVLIAAGALLGIGLGAIFFHRSVAVVLTRSGGLVAGGELSKALTRQTGNTVDPSGTVHIGSSFVDKTGLYCRTFAFTASPTAAGLACRTHQEWQVQVWAAGGNPQAAAPFMPPDLVDAVGRRIAGFPLDQVGETAALHRDWQSAQ